MKERRERDQLYKRALKCWGSGIQLFVAVEKLSDLITLLCKWTRGRIPETENIKWLQEQIADVRIMNEQVMVMMMGYESAPVMEAETQRIMDEKLKRLEVMIFEAEKAEG